MSNYFNWVPGLELRGIKFQQALEEVQLGEQEHCEQPSRNGGTGGGGSPIGSWNPSTLPEAILIKGEKGGKSRNSLTRSVGECIRLRAHGQPGNKADVIGSLHVLRNEFILMAGLPGARQCAVRVLLGRALPDLRFCP